MGSQRPTAGPKTHTVAVNPDPAGSDPHPKAPSAVVDGSGLSGSAVVENIPSWLAPGVPSQGNSPDPKTSLGEAEGDFYGALPVEVSIGMPAMAAGEAVTVGFVPVSVELESASEPAAAAAPIAQRPFVPENSSLAQKPQPEGARRGAMPELEPPLTTEVPRAVDAGPAGTPARTAAAAEGAAAGAAAGIGRSEESLAAPRNMPAANCGVANGGEGLQEGPVASLGAEPEEADLAAMMAAAGTGGLYDSIKSRKRASVKLSIPADVERPKKKGNNGKPKRAKQPTAAPKPGSAPRIGRPPAGAAETKQSPAAVAAAAAAATAAAAAAVPRLGRPPGPASGGGRAPKPPPSAAGRGPGRPPAGPAGGAGVPPKVKVSGGSGAGRQLGIAGGKSGPQSASNGKLDGSAGAAASDGLPPRPKKQGESPLDALVLL